MPEAMSNRNCATAIRPGPAKHHERRLRIEKHGFYSKLSVAITPWKRVRFTLGLGTRVAKRAMQFKGCKCNRQ